MGISEGCGDPGVSAGVKNQKGKKPEKELSYRSSDKGKDKTEKLMKSEAEVVISSGVAQILIQGKNGLGVLLGIPPPVCFGIDIITRGMH